MNAKFKQIPTVDGGTRLVRVSSRPLPARWMYQATPLSGRACILTSELRLIATALGLPVDEHPSSVFSTNTDIDCDALPLTDCRLVKRDMRDNRRELLRWVVAEYGRDKATLQRLGFLRKQPTKGNNL